MSLSLYHFRQFSTLAVGRYTLERRYRCKGIPFRDSDHDDLRSGRGGNARADPQAVAAWIPSAQPCAYRRVDRGCRARPRSRRLSSGRCGSRSVRRSSIPVFLARSFRHDGSRSGNQHRGGNPSCGATNLSERPNWSGQASLPNNEQ